MYLNTEKFTELQKKYKLTETETSKRMGIKRSTLWRAKKGQRVSGKFLIGFKNTFPGKKIESFFSYKCCSKMS